jgi:P27 family predicted phage terminase small subunit
MAVRGRRPKSNVVKLVSGSRRVNKREPRPKLALPEPPEHLDAVAKREWARVAPELYALGCLTALDTAALAIYCACWSMWVEAERHIDAEGATMVAPSGLEKPSPWLVIASSASKQMTAMAQEFGMTPASRGRIKAVPPEKPDAFEDLMNT